MLLYLEKSSLNDNIKGAMYSSPPEEPGWVWRGFSISHCFLIMLGRRSLNLAHPAEDTTPHVKSLGNQVMQALALTG